MRILNILCGIAVLLLTLHFTHFAHHFFVEAPHTAAFWAGIVFGAIVWILSFIGGCLLILRPR